MLTLIPAALLWLGALHLHRAKGLAPAAAHLCMLLAGVLALCGAAMLNVLPWGTAALFALFVLWTVLDIRRQGPAAWLAAARAFVTRPVLLAVGGSVLLAVVLSLRQPIFTYWDEFLITGTNAKVMALSGRMYTLGPTAAVSLEDPCATAVLSYLYQFFAPGFSETDLYISYGCFYLAVFAAAAEVVEKAVNRRAGTVFFAALALTPFLLGYHAYTLSYSAISYGYASSLADYPLAVGMFACVVLYLAAPRACWYWLPMAFTCLLKESGVLFTAVTAAVIAVWRLGELAGGWRGVLRWAGRTVLDLLAAMAGYLVWLVYLQLEGSTSPLPGILAAAVLGAIVLVWHAMGERRRAVCRAVCARAGAWLALWGLPAGAAGGTLLLVLLRFSGRFGAASERIQQAAAVLQGIFLPSLRDEAWQQTLDMEIDAFFHEKLFLPFHDWVVVLTLTALVLAACLLCARRKDAWRLAGSQLVLVLGAAAYLVTMAYFVAVHVQHVGLMEYPRYFTGYLFGWVYIVLLWVLAVPRRAQWGQIIAFAAALLCVGSVAQIGLEHTVVAAPKNYQQGVQRLRQYAMRAATVLQPQDHVLVMAESLNGYTPLLTGYYLYPVLINRAKVDTWLDYSGIFCVERDPADPDSGSYYLATAEKFALMAQKNFDYVLVMGESGHYAQDYGRLFDDGLEVGGLYRVVQDAAKPLQRVLDP